MSSMCVQFPSFSPLHEIKSQYHYQIQHINSTSNSNRLSCIIHILNTVYQNLISMYSPHSTEYLFRPQSGSVSLPRYPPSVSDVAFRSTFPHSCSENHTIAGIGNTSQSKTSDLGMNGLSLRNVLQNVSSITDLQNIVSRATIFSSKSRPCSGRKYLSDTPKTRPINSDTCLAKIAINQKHVDEDNETLQTADNSFQSQDAVSQISAPGKTEYGQSAKSRCSVNLSRSSPVSIKIPDVHLKEDVNSKDAYHIAKRVLLTGKKHRRVKSEHRASKSKIKLIKTGRMAGHSKGKTESKNTSNIYVNIQAQAKPLTVHKPVKSVLSKYSPDFNTRDNVTIANTYSLSAAFSSTSKSLNLPQMKNNYIMDKCGNTLSKDNTSGNEIGIKPHVAFSSPYCTTSSEVSRVSKVYLSEKQSGMIKDCGMEIPCAPPTTPTPEQMIKYEYVPCMNDIKSQRAVKVKLQVLEREAQKRVDRVKEEKAKVNKQIQKEQDKALKVRQRQEIYALNKVMTELENSRFMEFCRTKGLNS